MQVEIDDSAANHESHGHGNQERNNNLWIVLVGGEVYSHLDNKILGGHTSIISVGRAFSFYRQFVTRERIIVLAQLQECKKWHELEVDIKLSGITDETRRCNQTDMWSRKKADFFDSCGQLLAEGGADYDGEAVNPETLLRVLRGEKSEQFPRVVEYKKNATIRADTAGDDSQMPSSKLRVFLSVFSHGNWVPATDTHMFYLPYPSPSLRDWLGRINRRPYEEHELPPEHNEAVAVTEQASSSVGASNIVGPEVVPQRNPNRNRTPLLPSAPSDHPVSQLFGAAFTGYLPLPLRNDDGSLVALSTAAGECSDLPTNSSSESPGLSNSISSTSSILNDGVCPVHIHLKSIDFDKTLTKRQNKLRPLSNEENRILDCYDASNFHWQYLFDALRFVFEQYGDSLDAFFVMQQTCGSGGMWQWLTEQSYHEQFGCARWPLYTFYTAEPCTSAVGSSWDAFHRVLKDQFQIWQHRQQNEDDGERQAIGASTVEPTGDLSLLDLFEVVESRYFDMDPGIKRHLQRTKEDLASRNHERFGCLGRAFGSESGVEKMTVSRMFFGS